MVVFLAKISPKAAIRCETDMLAPGIACAERWSPGCIENANLPSGKPATDGILIELDCLRIPEQLQRA